MNPTSWPDLFLVRQFFEPHWCERIVAEMKTGPSGAATVYGHTHSGAIDERVRKTIRVTPTPATIASVVQRLWSCKAAIEKHFSVSVTECEEPQFLQYNEGDYFVAHQDGNTGLMRLESERRRISLVVFLSRESDEPGPNVHCGGSLVFTNLRAPLDQSKFRLTGEPGMLVAFRSETTHEVTPVTQGERFSIASWYK